MRFSPSRWKTYLPHPLTLLSGFLMVAAFPPWNNWPLLWICAFTWFEALKRAPNPKAALREGFWLSYITSIGGFHWVAFVLKEFGNLPWSLSILGLQIFCFFNQPQFIVSSWLFKHLEIRFKDKNIERLAFGVFFSLMYAGLDFILPKIFMDTLGNGFYVSRHIRQIADIGGIYSLTFLLIFENYALWIFLRTWQKRRKIVFSPLVVSALVLGLAGWGYGYFRYQQITRLEAEAPKKIQIAAIQGNIGDFDKIASERGVSGAATRVVNTYLGMSAQALEARPKPEILVWPETSFPSTFRKSHTYTEIALEQQIEDFSKNHQIPLLFGGYDHDRGKDYNAFFYLAPDGSLQTYRKNILLMFGEYIPLAENIDWIRDTFPQVGNFGRGEGAQILPVKVGSDELRTGPMICYEALFPYYIIQAARKGSQIIMNITNDSWFGSWAEPQLHLALTTFRSIETRLPMLRSTNTGISTLVTADGEITYPTQIGHAEILQVEVPITASIPTLMKTLGDWFGLFALLVGSGGLMIFYRSVRS